MLGATHGASSHGVWTDRPGTLSNDFFVHLVETDVEWTRSKDGRTFTARRRGSKETLRTATVVDLIFGSNFQLRRLAEAYAASDARERFVKEFVHVWHKVIRLDRFDVQRPSARVARSSKRQDQ